MKKIFAFIFGACVSMAAFWAFWASAEKDTIGIGPRYASLGIGLLFLYTTYRIVFSKPRE